MSNETPQTNLFLEDPVSSTKNKELPWLPGSSDGKESACDAGDLGLIPGLGRSPKKGMATHSSILAWRITQTEEPGRLWSMGLQRVQQD